jgi:hypothetical protein
MTTGGSCPREIVQDLETVATHLDIGKTTSGPNIAARANARNRAGFADMLNEGIDRNRVSASKRGCSSTTVRTRTSSREFQRQSSA